MLNIKKTNIFENLQEKRDLAKGNSYKTISGFVSRNLAEQQGVGRYIQSAERENLPNKNIIFGKNGPQKGRIKTFLDKHRLRDFITTILVRINSKESFNMKHKNDRKQHESINFTGKGKYINKTEYYNTLMVRHKSLNSWYRS